MLGRRALVALVGVTLCVGGLAVDAARTPAERAVYRLDVVSAESPDAVRLPEGTVRSLPTEAAALRAAAGGNATVTVPDAAERRRSGAATLVDVARRGATARLSRLRTAYLRSRSAALRTSADVRRRAVDGELAAAAAQRKAAAARLGLAGLASMDQFAAAMADNYGRGEAVTVKGPVDEFLTAVLVRERAAARQRDLTAEAALLTSPERLDALAGTLLGRPELVRTYRPPVGNRWLATSALVLGAALVALALLTARRRGIRRLGIGVVAVVGLWCVGVVTLALLVRRDAAAVRRSLGDLQPTAMTSSDARHDLRGRLVVAERSFRRADGNLSSWLLQPTRLLPAADAQLERARTTLGAAEVAASEGVRLIDALDRFATEARAGDAARVAALDRLAPALAEARRALDVARPRGVAMIGPLAGDAELVARRHDEILELLDGATRGVEAMRSMLRGGRYLLVAGNAAEGRAGQGAYLSLAPITVRNGSVEVGEVYDAASAGDPATTLDVLPEGSVALGDADMKRHVGLFRPNRIWATLGLDARFDVNASLVADMWERRTGDRVDGVVYLDSMAMADLLQLTGPIVVDGFAVDASTVTDELLVGQYDRFTTIPERKAWLHEFTRLVTSGLLATNDPFAALDPIRHALASRHLMLWSRRSAERGAISDLQLGGTLGPTSLAVTVPTMDGKYAPAVHVAASLSAVCRPDRMELSLDTTVTLARSPRIPDYADAAYSWNLPQGTLVGFLMVNVPGAASSVTVGDVPEAFAGPDGPTRLAGTVIRVPVGGSTTVTTRWTMPRGVPLELAAAGSVHGIAWSFAGYEWDGSIGRRLDPSSTC